MSSKVGEVDCHHTTRVKRSQMLPHYCKVDVYKQEPGPSRNSEPSTETSRRKNSWTRREHSCNPESFDSGYSKWSTKSERATTDQLLSSSEPEPAVHQYSRVGVSCDEVNNYETVQDIGQNQSSIGTPEHCESPQYRSVCDKGTLLSLLSGLLSLGGLLMAESADFWLLTCEDINYLWVDENNKTESFMLTQEVCVHAGLWRQCTGKLYTQKVKTPIFIYNIKNSLC